MANSCKYYKQKKQFSTNSGQTWQDVTPFEYRRGSFIEADSPDCREETLISRWITVPDAFLCDGKDEYEKQVGQYSLDNGATWQYYYPSMYQTGNLIETNSQICNNKWEGYYEFTGSTENLCPDGYMYVSGRGCVPIPTVKVDPVRYIRCSSTTSTTLSRDDIAYVNYSVYSGKIGDCITNIDNQTFGSFYNLTGITIGNSVRTIGNQAFYDCISLETITIPDTVTSIGNSAFNGCTSLSSVTIGHGVTSIGNNAFAGCTGLTTIKIPDNVIILGDEVFGYCYDLTSITIGSGVTYIGNDAFSNCTSLTSITIPNSVTSIGQYAFNKCSGLTSVTIGSGVTSIGYYAFYKCTSLTGITCLVTTPPSLGTNAFNQTNDCPIYVPCESVNTYKSASGWSTYASRIVGDCPKWTATYSDSHTESAQCGSSSAITNNEITKSGLTSVEISDCVTSIGQNVFSGCTTLTSITIPNSVTSIGYSAFYNCSGLTSVTIPSGVTTIEGWTFYNCDGLTSITIPSGVTSIGSSAFMTCSNIEDITIPNTVTSIGTYAFSSCISLQTVTLPNSITTLPDNTFRECDNLAMINSENIGEFNIPSGVISLGYGLFTSCYSLQYLIIPSTVTTIEKNILQGCRDVLIVCNAVNPPALTDTFGGSITQIRVPSASVEAYKSASGWSQYANKIYPN